VWGRTKPPAGRREGRGRCSRSGTEEARAGAGREMQHSTASGRSSPASCGGADGSSWQPRGCRSLCHEDVAPASKARTRSALGKRSVGRWPAGDRGETRSLRDLRDHAEVFHAPGRLG
jgi:hypothetical protein